MASGCTTQQAPQANDDFAPTQQFQYARRGCKRNTRIANHRCSRGRPNKSWYNALINPNRANVQRESQCNRLRARKPPEEFLFPAKPQAVETPCRGPTQQRAEAYGINDSSKRPESSTIIVTRDKSNSVVGRNICQWPAPSRISDFQLFDQNLNADVCVPSASLRLSIDSFPRPRWQVRSQFAWCIKIAAGWSHRCVEDNEFEKSEGPIVGASRGAASSAAALPSTHEFEFQRTCPSVTPAARENEGFTGSTAFAY